MVRCAWSDAGSGIKSYSVTFYQDGGGQPLLAPVVLPGDSTSYRNDAAADSLGRALTLVTGSTLRAVVTATDWLGLSTSATSQNVSYDASVALVSYAGVRAALHRTLAQLCLRLWW
jgi:hypothetical protein